jgi:hypothetical protein
MNGGGGVCAAHVVMGGTLNSLERNVPRARQQWHGLGQLGQADANQGIGV